MHAAEWFGQRWNDIVGEPGKGALDVAGVREAAADIERRAEQERALTGQEDRPEAISVGRCVHNE